MDNRRTIVLVIAFGAFVLLWMTGVGAFQRYMGWTAPVPQEEPAAVEDPTTQPAGAAGVEPDLPAPTVSDETAAAEQAAQPGAIVAGNLGTPQTVVLGSDEAEDETYALQVTFNSVGAGIDRVVLNGYKQVVDDDARYTFEVPYEEAPNATRPMATRSVQFAGATIPLNDVPWRVVRQTDTEVAFEVDLVRDGEAVGSVLKEFRIYGREEPAPNGTIIPHGGYDIRVRETIRNASGQTVAARSTIQGPTSPPQELEQGYDRVVIRGVLGSNGVKYEADQVESFDADDPRQIFEQAQEPLMWAGTGTIYFNAILRPAAPAPEDGNVVAPRTLNRVVAEATNPNSSRPDRHVALRFVNEAVEIAPGESHRQSYFFFTGPKKRSLLENEYYGGAGVEYNETLRSPFGCTWCVFQPVVDILVLLLTMFHAIFGDWGLAIIGLVCLVRLMLHPITKRSQKNLLRLSKLAPKMQAIKEKYGDDKEKIAAAMAEVAPEQMSALLLGCLPMLLQTPIWIALYSSLQATFELRHEPFLYGYTWIDDLAQPDRLIDFGEKVTLIPEFFPLIGGFGLTGINILPILMGVVFFLQIKIQPQPTTALSDEQRRQQKLMQVLMVCMFPLFLYAAPSGLNLYILTSTTIGIIESATIRRNLKRQEEEQERIAAEYAARGETPPEPPKGAFAKRFAGFREKVAQRVEEAQKEMKRREAMQQGGGGNKRGNRKR